MERFLLVLRAGCLKKSAFELMICDKYGGENTGPQSVQVGTHLYVTAYRNAVTLQVTDTIRSYDLNFHPVPHDLTVSCLRYTVGFPVCYGSQKARGADGGDVSRCTARPTQAVTVSSL
jgi:hypothetical protein